MFFLFFFGWTPFDNTNSSGLVAGIGNPMALHRGKKWSMPPCRTNAFILRDGCLNGRIGSVLKKWSVWEPAFIRFRHGGEMFLRIIRLL